jgi:hypothetical protein
MQRRNVVRIQPGGAASDLGMPLTPTFMRSAYADASLISEFLELHRALSKEHDLLQQKERLLDSFGKLFHRYGTGGLGLRRGRIVSWCSGPST